MGHTHVLLIQHARSVQIQIQIQNRANSTPSPVLYISSVPYYFLYCVHRMSLYPAQAAGRSIGQGQGPERKTRTRIHRPRSTIRQAKAEPVDSNTGQSSSLVDRPSSPSAPYARPSIPSKRPHLTPHAWSTAAPARTTTPSLPATALPSRLDSAPEVHSRTAAPALSDPRNPNTSGFFGVWQQIADSG